MAESKSTKPAASDDMKAAEAAAAEVQKTTDEAEAKGYIGETPETRPNSDFTVAGVTKGGKV